jgi:hypothetical protein
MTEEKKEETPTEEKSMKQKIDEVHSLLAPQLEQKGKQKKPKKFKLPSKGKVSKAKIKKGWTGIMMINENKEISFEKQPIINSTLKTKDENYHALNSDAILTYKGKPMIIQVSTKLNPWQPNQKTIMVDDTGKEVEAPVNQVYGQKHVMARMMTDEIKGKKRGGGGMLLIIGAVLVGGYLLGHYVLKIF